jgi:hypothetical protein
MVHAAGNIPLVLSSGTRGTKREASANHDRNANGSKVR